MNFNKLFHHDKAEGQDDDKRKNTVIRVGAVAAGAVLTAGIAASTMEGGHNSEPVKDDAGQNEVVTNTEVTSLPENPSEMTVQVEAPASEAPVAASTQQETPSVVALPHDGPDVALPHDGPDVALPHDGPDVALPHDGPDVALPTDGPSGGYDQLPNHGDIAVQNPDGSTSMGEVPVGTSQG